MLIFRRKKYSVYLTNIISGIAIEMSVFPSDNIITIISFGLLMTFRFAKTFNSCFMLRSNVKIFPIIKMSSRNSSVRF